MSETYANLGSSTLAADIDDTDDALTLAAGGSFPVTGNFRIIVDDEIIIVGTRAGNVLSDLTRAAEDPSVRPPAAHVAGSAVVQVLTRGGFLQGIADALAASQGGFISGEGPPEGVAVAVPGVIYADTDGGELYLKAGGAGSSGWTLMTHAELTVHAAYSGLLDDDHPQYLREGILTTVGDMPVGQVTSGFTITRLSAGIDGQELTADSTATRGMKYA